MIQFRTLEGSSTRSVRSALSPFTFPAGEAHTKREERRHLGHTEIAILTPGQADSIHDDLFQLAMWKNAIDAENDRSYTVRTALLIPYFPGARADRGEPFGLSVYANFVNKLRIDHVGIVDPHSPVLTRNLATDAVLYPQDIIPRSIGEQYDGIVAPDKGAVARAGAVAEEFGLPLFTATKQRDPNTGKLSNYALSATNGTGQSIRDGFKLLVVDDICDGGGTFMLLSKAVRATALAVTLDLYVSHGVFSGQALLTLPQVYNHVYTTNSIQRTDWGPFGETFTHLDVLSLMLAQIPTSVGAR